MLWPLHGKFPPVYPETWSELPNSLLKVRGARGGGEEGNIDCHISHRTFSHFPWKKVKLYCRVTVVASVAVKFIRAQFLQKEGWGPPSIHCIYSIADNASIPTEVFHFNLIWILSPSKHFFVQVFGIYASVYKLPNWPKLSCPQSSIQYHIISQFTITAHN